MLDRKLPVIDPEFQSMYDWDNDQSSPYEIKIMFPIFSPKFSQDMVNVELKDNKVINVTFEDGPPLLCGVLQEEISDFLLFLSGNNLVLVLKKVKDTEWPLVVIDFHPENRLMDPKTLYVLSFSNPNGNSITYLSMACGFRFVPAMNVFAITLLNQGNPEFTESAIELLKIASEQYNSSSSLLHLGAILTYSSNCEEAYQYLLKALEMGETEASSYLGELYSPFSRVTLFKEKDSAKAIEYYQKYESPISLYGMYVIYLKGDNKVKKNMKLAKEYYEKAKKLNPEIEDFPEEKRSITPFVAAGAVAVAAISYVVFRVIKRQK
ncbi:sel1 repeat family protein [Histomonas meleagridis]|uniref:sel1 repeat family protein n=1 Tax=Histomonas meleagridis TaxID=135588 RepID=UPI00355A5C22|nr:sel1 repeat family protein [Histomonas meleagridis]KAH0797065.1 sel1 repeat family protein [Histomonas meleagridis]